MFPSCIQTDDADIVVVGGVFALWLQLQPSVVSKPLFRTGQIHHDTPGIWWSIACQNAQRSHQIRSFVSQQKGADAFKHACFRLGRQPSNVSWRIEVIEPHEPTAATVNQYWDRICGFQNYLFWLFTCVEIVFAMYGTSFLASSEEILADLRDHGVSCQKTDSFWSCRTAACPANSLISFSSRSRNLSEQQ